MPAGQTLYYEKHWAEGWKGGLGSAMAGEGAGLHMDLCSLLAVMNVEG